MSAEKEWWWECSRCDRAVKTDSAKRPVSVCKGRTPNGRHQACDYTFVFTLKKIPVVVKEEFKR